MKIDKKNDVDEIPEGPIKMKKKVVDEDLEIIYQNFKNMSNRNLDLFLLKIKEYLDKIAIGRDLPYLEKRISQIIDVIYVIKEERISHK